MRRWWKRPTGTGFVVVDDGVVGWFAGGEPINGCDWVAVLVHAPSEAEAWSRVGEIGLWSPYLMDGFGDPDADLIRRAVSDPRGFVWNDADGGGWWPGTDLLGAFEAGPGGE